MENDDRSLDQKSQAQLRRRARVAGLFPNEASILRLVSAILMEISEEWESGKTYLPQISSNSPKSIK
jgi:transposase-like protein